MLNTISVQFYAYCTILSRYGTLKNTVNHVAVGTGACVVFHVFQSDETRRSVEVLNPMRDKTAKTGTGERRDQQLGLLSAQKATGLQVR